MDLSKETNERKLFLCRWYFRVGFLLLPFVWAINVAWFFDDAFHKPTSEEQKQIRKYVICSSLGTCIWLVSIFVWQIIYQIYRGELGEYGDYISFIIPLGKP